MYKQLIVALFSLSLVPFAYADFSGGKAAHENGDYAAAYKEFKAAAELGNADAQFMLGLMYHLGRGITPDNMQAMTWYRKAGEQGNAKAQAMLGDMYDAGNGVRQDYNEAVKWYRKAADQGLALPFTLKM